MTACGKCVFCEGTLYTALCLSSVQPVFDCFSGGMVLPHFDFFDMRLDNLPKCRDKNRGDCPDFKSDLTGGGK